MDSNLFGKSKASELRAELSQARKKAKPHARVKVILKKVISNIILNKIELASLMNDMIYLLTLNDYEISRLCSHYIVHYATYNPGDASNALDFYRRFGHEKDPLLRALAVKTVSSVPLKDFMQLAIELVQPLLYDTNPHVRTASAFAVARLFHEIPEKIVSSGLIEDLNTLLYDDNKNVVANALAALDSITQTSSNHALNINKEHLILLISGIGTANEWKQVYLLNALMSFVPQKSDDALEMMEAILPCLQHENTSVVLNSIKLVVYLSNFIESPEIAVPSLDKRLGAALVSLLFKPYEIQFLVLRNVILLLLGRRYLLDVDVEQFFWKFDDPMYIKDTKLEIIYLLANEDNIEVVFRELEEYATDVDTKMARKAIRAFGNLSIKLEVAAKRCVLLLADLLATDSPHIAQEVAIVTSNIIRMYPGTYDSILDHVMGHHKIIVDSEARSAIAWMAGHCCEKISIVDELFQELCSSFETEPLTVQQAIMTSVVKYYVKYPVKGESLVLKVLKHATERSDNPDLRERGYFYWRMISNEKNGSSGDTFQKFTKHIVVDVNCHITPDTENIDPSNLEELELNIGLLASIYLKSIRKVFRFAKPSSLPASPVLQERRKNEPYKIGTKKKREDAFEAPKFKLSPFFNSSANRSNVSFASASSNTSGGEKLGRDSLKDKLVRRASTMINKRLS